MFDALNNQSMQGPGFTVINHNAKITAYYEKLNPMARYMKQNEYDMFSQLKAYLSESNVNMQEIITEHLEQLTKKLEQYYDAAITPANKQDCMIDSFTVANFPELPLHVAKELMEMTAEALNHFSFVSFKKKHLTLSTNIYFWISMCQVYPIMSKFVIEQQISFATTYHCEAGFSTMIILKTKHRNQQNVQDDMHLCLSNITPRFQQLTQNMKAHCSYSVY